MKKELEISIVDAFTKKSFSGNPAGVCIIKNEELINDELKQLIAKEMNLSETSFVIYNEKLKPLNYHSSETYHP